jgi:hypothetical protein
VPPRQPPDPAEIHGWMTSLSNWGRWGPDDELGTLNLISSQHITAAAGLVRLGRPVPCGWPVDPAIPGATGSPVNPIALF